MIRDDAPRGAVAGMVALPLVPGMAGRETVGSIARLDPALDAMIDPASPIRSDRHRLPMGRGAGMGATGRISALLRRARQHRYRWKAGEGCQPFLDPPAWPGQSSRGAQAGSNGMAIDARGDLLMADSGTRAIAQVNLATRRKTIVSGAFEPEVQQLQRPGDPDAAESSISPIRPMAWPKAMPRRSGSSISAASIRVDPDSTSLHVIERRLKP